MPLSRRRFHNGSAVSFPVRATLRGSGALDGLPCFLDRVFAILRRPFAQIVERCLELLATAVETRIVERGERGAHNLTVCALVAMPLRAPFVVEAVLDPAMGEEVVQVLDGSDPRIVHVGNVLGLDDRAVADVLRHGKLDEVEVERRRHVAVDEQRRRLTLSRARAPLRHRRIGLDGLKHRVTDVASPSVPDVRDDVVRGPVARRLEELTADRLRLHVALAEPRRDRLADTRRDLVSQRARLWRMTLRESGHAPRVGEAPDQASLFFMRSSRLRTKPVGEATSARVRLSQPRAWRTRGEANGYVSYERARRGAMPLEQMESHSWADRAASVVTSTTC
jgi:hypothetical protein